MIDYIHPAPFLGMKTGFFYPQSNEPKKREIQLKK